MDLPPVVGQRLGGGGQQQQMAQRPSISYLVFLSVLFFMLSSNNGGEVIGEADGTLQRMRDALATREGKREGLARWLGVANETAWEESNKSENGTATPTNTSRIIDFVPKNHTNPVLLPMMHSLLDRRRGQRLFYSQNLTGFARGKWSAGNWSYQELGLAETFNTTELKPEKLEIEDELKEKEGEGSAVAKNGEREGKDDSASTTTIARRQLDDPALKVTNSTNTTLTPPARLVKMTVTTNRTDLRHEFAWAKGGRVVFNFREEQTSAVGAAVVPEGDDGELLMMREGGAKEPWEEEGPVVYLHGDITFTSFDEVEEVVLDIEGAHFLSQGTFYAFVTPNFIRSHLFDVVGLPSFDSASRSNTSSVAAGHLMLKEVDRRIVNDRKEIAEATAFSRDDDASSTGGPSCVFTLYGSISPLPSYYTPPLYAEYYASLFHPSGSSLRPPPPPTVSYSLYSENCGLVLEGTAESLSSPRVWERATSYAIVMGGVQAMLLVLLVRQMEGGGPSSASKVAYSTVMIQAAMDSYFFVIMLTVGIVTNNRASVPLLVPAFLALISFLVFGMRYTAAIRAAAPPPVPRLVPPPPPPPPTREALSAAAAERRATATEERAEGPATALLAASIPAVVVTPPGEDSDVVFVLSGFAAAVLAGTVIVFWGWMGLIMVLVYSYWIPQIVLNVQRGAARLALRREYVIGTTLGRLVLPFYFWGYSNNVLSIETNNWIYALVLYSSFQASILLLQDSRLGARFFLPYTLRARFSLTETETWDYHPILSPDLESQHAEDCPICLAPIQLVPNKEQEEEAGAVDKMRWGYMVPPCHHLAHTACLESWLAIKSVCPVCRGRLPPL